MWVVDQMASGNPAYNIPFAYRIRGELDPHALEESINQIIQRHESWRTTFRESAGHPLQVIHAECRVQIRLTDLAHLPTAEREPKFQALSSEEGLKSFDLRSLPLLRVSLFRLGEAEHVLLINVHHIICDVWSCAIFARELTALYAAFRSGQPNPLPELALHYGDYAQWQQEKCTDAAMAAHLAFWRERLGGDRAPLPIPADRPRPAQQSQRGGMRVRDLSAGLAVKVRDLAREEGVTPFILTLAAFKALLARYSGETDICIGSPIAQRPNVETEKLIGFFLNMLALRSDLSGNPDFRELLRRVRSTVLEAFQHQDAPFEKIVEDLDPSRTLSHQPLFQIAFVLLPAGGTLPAFAGATVVPLTVPVTTAKFDLTLFIEETPGGLRAMLEYSADQFDATTADRMLESLELLLEGIVADPSTPLSRLPILSVAQRQRILTEWSGAERPYPQDQTIAARFAECAAQTPTAIAVIEGRERLTYGKLDARANRVARFLQSRGIRAGDFVGLRAERSLAFVVKLLGIAKAGAAYVPLDGQEPAARLATMQAACALILDAEPDAGVSTDPVSSDAQPDGPAYVLFTSGSTGVPKGVIIPHRGITRLVMNNDYAPFQPDDVVAFASNVCFDAATFEIWGALLNGGALVITPREVLLSPTALAAHLATHRVTVLFLTTSLFNRLAHEAPAMFRSLRILVFGGEAADAASVRLVVENGKPTRLVNGYGPTETTTFAICHAIEKIDGSTVPIGRPIANTRVFILDGELQPVPIGMAGEICIGGPGVALGYHGAPKLTAEKFIETSYGRLYRTGDLARWLPDGTIDYLGRHDEQLKLRGFRIEPGEIEAALQDHPLIRQTVVVARTDAHAVHSLIGYLVPHSGEHAETTELREFLSHRLPACMIPSAFVWVDALPLTANGKLDRRALPEPTAETKATREYAPPQNSVQAQLIEIWEEVLNRKPIGIRDNFFDLGGHSLLVARVIALTLERLGHRLPFAEFFANATIEAHARSLSGSQGTVRQTPYALIHPTGRQTPVFFFHGDVLGSGIFCKTLARMIGADRPFYVIPPHGTQGDEIPLTVEAMAAERLEWIRQIQPRGPYIIGGYCNGALLAYQSARLLRDAGEPVTVVLMLMADGSNIRFRLLQRLSAVTSALRREDEAAKRLRFLKIRNAILSYETLGRYYRRAAADWLKQRPRVQIARLWRKMRRVLRRFVPAAYRERLLGDAGRAPLHAAASPQHKEAIMNIYEEIFNAHVSHRHDSPVALFWPKDEPQFSSRHPADGWKKICAQLEVVEVPGDHTSCVAQDTNVVMIGEAMRKSIAQAERLLNQPSP